MKYIYIYMYYLWWFSDCPDFNSILLIYLIWYVNILSIFFRAQQENEQLRAEKEKEHSISDALIKRNKLQIDSLQKSYDQKVGLSPIWNHWSWTINFISPSDQNKNLNIPEPVNLEFKLPFCFSGNWQYTPIVTESVDQ